MSCSATEAALQWVFCWENLSSFMCCWQDEIHLLGDFRKRFVKPCLYMVF